MKITEVRAVPLTVPVADAETVQVAVMVTLLLLPGRFTVSLTLPDCDGGAGDTHVPPFAPLAQVHVQPVSCGGKLSVTMAPLASLGPALEATMV